MSLRIFFLFFGLLLLFLFVAPIFLRICNVGNLVGIFFALCCLMLSRFWTPVSHFVQHIWQTTGGKILLSLLALLIAAGIGLAVFFSVRMAQQYQNPPKSPCTVVVLGCKVKGETPSLMLQRRLDAAYAYLTAHPNVSCIVSGGKGTGEHISEAQAMQTYLVHRGIAEERIFMENRSTDTYENLKYSKEILEQQKLPMQVTIITDGFHQYRASRIAKKIGLESWSVSGETRKILIPTYWVREWFALVEQLLGWT